MSPQEVNVKRGKCFLFAH
uniref:Uncharacterized protein n=1 Tax=Anguilla anguilla TaxID=7936 RepID=A0A0E9UY08_ANGAN